MRLKKLKQQKNKEQKEKNFISYDDYSRRLNLFNQVNVYYKRSLFKFYSGLCCLFIGIIPNGLGFIFYPLGFYLLNINKKDVYSKIYLYRIKFKYGFKII